MANQKRLKYYFLSKLCGLSKIFLFLFLLISYSYINEIQSFFWHIKHPDPIVMNGLKVTIPKAMKVKKGAYSWRLYPFNPSINATITIGKADINQKENPLGFLRDDGYTLNEIPCKSSVGACKWFQASNLKEDISFVEKIIFTTQGVEISFSGTESERRYLLEIIDNLQPYNKAIESN